MVSKEALHQENPQGVPAQLSKDDPMKVVPSEQATQRDDDTQDQTKPEDHHATDGHEWPESWSGATAWQSWGNWSDWTWGAGWHKSDWKSDWDQQPLSQEHVQWRNRTASLRSYSEDSQSFYGRGWSKDTLETPAYRKSGSLDSELAAAFQRLDTVDRLADSELPKVALDKKFAETENETPQKKQSQTPSTTPPHSSPPPSFSQQSSPSSKAEETPSPNPSQSKAPDANATIQTQSATGKSNDTSDSKATQSEEKKSGQSEKETEDENSKAARKAAEQAEKKKVAHARYMRYWRSVHGGAPGYWIMGEQRLTCLLLCRCASTNFDLSYVACACIH